jgi:hypothetical protein
MNDHESERDFLDRIARNASVRDATIRRDAFVRAALTGILSASGLPRDAAARERAAVEAVRVADATLRVLAGAPPEVVRVPSDNGLPDGMLAPFEAAPDGWDADAAVRERDVARNMLARAVKGYQEGQTR